MEREQLFNYFEQRFGIGREVFSHLEFYEKSKGRIYSIDKDAFPFLDSVKPISGGLLFARIGGGIKPTSVIMQVFGKHAAKNVLELDEKQTKEYISGLDLDIEQAKRACIDTKRDEVDIDPIEKRSTSTILAESVPSNHLSKECIDGYVILRSKNYFLGIGLLKSGKLKNMLQKGKRTKVEFL